MIYMTVSNKSVGLVLLEAFIVGVGLIIVQYVISKVGRLNIVDFMNKEYIIFVFVSGVIFHVGFEYTGVNMWYAKEYCKLV